MLYSNVREQMEALQAEIDLEVAAGNHPFNLLCKLNGSVYGELSSLPIYTGIWRTRVLANQNAEHIESEQVRILELLKPYWDLADATSKGRVAMKFTPKRVIAQRVFVLKVDICFFHVDDLDNFQIMQKLHDLQLIEEVI